MEKSSQTWGLPCIEKWVTDSFTRCDFPWNKWVNKNSTHPSRMIFFSGFHLKKSGNCRSPAPCHRNNLHVCGRRLQLVITTRYRINGDWTVLPTYYQAHHSKCVGWMHLGLGRMKYYAIQDFLFYLYFGEDILLPFSRSWIRPKNWKNRPRWRWAKN